MNAKRGGEGETLKVKFGEDEEAEGAVMGES